MIDITSLIKTAIKDKDAVATKVYRAIKAEELKYITSGKDKEINDNVEINILKKMKSQYEDSIQQYRDNQRFDLVEEESRELRILEQLLPESVSKEYIIDQIKNKYEMPIQKKDMGKIIKELKDMFIANDGKEISDIVKSFIG